MTVVIRNAAELVCVSRAAERAKRGPAMRDPAIVPDGAVVLSDGQIDWVGSTRDLPPLPPTTEVIDATGKTVLPGFVDSHTHLIFAGSREDEFEQRLGGKTYHEIAAAGGGINSTVRQVRQTSKKERKGLARQRPNRLLNFGFTTHELNT